MFLCTFKLFLFFFWEIFLLFRLFLFTVHVRPVLSPCQAGFDTIISHIMHIIHYLYATYCFHLFSTVFFWITGFCLTTFLFIILIVSIQITLYELVYNIIYIYICNAYFDLQNKFCFMLYIVIIA